MAMPTGTRSSINTKSTTKPMTATTSVLTSASLDGLDRWAAAEDLRPHDETEGAHRDQQHRRDVAQPGDEEERPDRQVEVVGQHMVGACRHHFVEERAGLHGHHAEQHQRRENIDRLLHPRSRRRPDEVDGYMRAAIAGGGDAPENEDAQEHP